MPKASASAPVSPGTSSLLTMPTYVLAKLGRTAQRLSQDVVAGRDLLLPHFSVLVTLDDAGPLPQHQLADRLGVHRSHLVGYVDELERRKAIRRQRDPRDRRRQVVSLTAAGRRLLARLRAPMAELQDEFLAPLSESEWTVLMDLLLRLLAHADELGEPGSGPASNGRSD